jgi:3-dehydroshikimate dehydratase
MIKSGLVSVSFRKWSPEKIIESCVSYGLTGIEWGGDIHVPPGDIALAKSIASATRDAGCEVAAYGSYYRSVDQGEGFKPVLESALALGAPVVRVWAGDCGSDKADKHKRDTVVNALRACAEQAQSAGIRIGLEFHRNTLTDTIDSTLDLLKAIDHPTVGSLWQPPVGMPPAEAVNGLELILPWLMHLHVFNWTQHPEDKSTIRHPLAEGVSQWQQYLSKAISAKPSYALLEFIRDDSEAQLREDAEALNSWLSQL